MTTTDSDFLADLSPAKTARPRLDGVDLLRGVVMIVMVLDHSREFLGRVDADPTDLTTTTIGLFFTRWITHFCAPVFVFLAGTGAYLYARRGKTTAETSRFLLTRGIWLVVLELTIVRLGMTFDGRFQFLPLTVIWVIGVSMIVLSALVWLPSWFVGGFGLVMIAGHNAFDGVKAESWGRYGDLWRLLHEGGLLRLRLPSWGLGDGPGPDGFPRTGRVILALYPLIPWIGVMAAGFSFGALFRLEPRRRRPIFLAIGLAITAGFVALRAWNVYGDPVPWASEDRGPVFTVLSFLNCDKYPPSLLYLLMTLGPAIALLAGFDRPAPALARPIVILGRVPLFFYLLQWPMLHVMAIAVSWCLGQPFAWLIGNGPFNAPKGYGNGLPMVYVMWLVTVVALYPACFWFADLKRRRRDAW